MLASLFSFVSESINPFNPFPNSGYRRPSNNRVYRFRDYLISQGHVVTIRSTRGDDIDAACGQLVGNVEDRTRRSQKYSESAKANATRIDAVQIDNEQDGRSV